MQQTDENWQEGKVLWQKGKHLLETSLWSDCCFVAGEEGAQQEFKAHKLFLAMASPVFAAMFYGPIAEKDGAIAMQDVTKEGFKLLLDYIYTDNVNIGNFNEARHVCYAAKKYLIPGLEKICLQKLRAFLNPTTACFTYEFASWIENEQLVEEARSVISSRTTEVLNDPNIGEVQQSTLDTILDMDCLTISNELELFEAVSVWAKCECTRKGAGADGERLRAVAGPLLRKVRFLTLQPRQLAQGPAASALLSREESYALLMNASAPGDCPVPLPRGFCASTDHRTAAASRAMSADTFFDCAVPIKTFSVTTFEGRKGIHIAGLKMNISFGSSGRMNGKVWMWESSGTLERKSTVVVEEKWTEMHGSGKMSVVCYFKNRYPVKENSKYVIIALVSTSSFNGGSEGTVEYVKGFFGTNALYLLPHKNEFEIFVKNETVQSIIAYRALEQPTHNQNNGRFLLPS